MDFIYDNIFYIIAFICAVLTLFTYLFGKKEDNNRVPTEKVVNLCNTFETDNWIIETKGHGKNTALAYYIKEILLKNTDKELSFMIRYHTDYSGKIDYTHYNIKVKAPWLTESEEKDISKHNCKHRSLDPLLYPEIKQLSSSNSN